MQEEQPRIKGYLQEISRSNGSWECVGEPRWRGTVAQSGGDMGHRQLGEFR